jgi:hypothetical protein
MDQYLVPESAEPMQTPSALTPDGAVPQVPTRRVALGPQGSTLNAGSRIVDLIAGTAKVGVGAATLVAVEITSRSRWRPRESPRPNRRTGAPLPLGITLCGRGEEPSVQPPGGR